MRRVAALLLAAASACSVEVAQEPQSSSKRAPVGINLSAVNYYATQLPFRNLFRNRDDWQSTDGETWDTELADTIPVDDDGYPLQLPYRGQMVRSSVFLPVQQDTFELTWKGSGTVTVEGSNLTLLETTQHAVEFSLPASLTDPVFVRIERSDPEDHVRGIELHGRRMYDAEFMDNLRGFEVLRFMDWGATNNSELARWNDRTRENEAQGTDRGVAIELMIDTANSAQADMWLNIPHKADDDFIERAAKLIDSRLDAGLKVYVEYSNENWNGIFSQMEWQKEQGEAEGLDQVKNYRSQDEAVFWGGMNYSVRRAAVAHHVFRRVLGEDRVVAVLAGQSANSGLNGELLAAYADELVNPLGGQPDALAVAPYFGEIYGDTAEVKGLTVERILTDARASIPLRVGQDTRDNRAVADEYGVRLIAYEAGQHLVATGGLEEDDEVVELLIKANRDPRMGELYREAHKQWVDNGGELVVYFSSCEAPGKYGSWGALEYQDQPQADAPKWAALRGFLHQ